MPTEERRSKQHDRRRVPRGGRRPYDRPGRYPRVLLADSYDAARRPCVRYLDLFSFEVAEAANGEEAISQIVAKPPQVILADWALPTMPAPRLAQWLGQSWRTRDIPVIVMTGDFEPDPVVGFPTWTSAVLVKPFGLATMLEQVRRVLRSASTNLPDST